MPTATPLPPVSPILLWDRKLENKKCEPVLVFDEKLAELVDRLKSTCYSHKAVGLAAPQINEFVRVAIVHYPHDKEPLVLVNPIIDEINSKGEQVDYEACLSLPTSHRVHARVRRCNEIIFTYQDLTGARTDAKERGVLARIIAHEVDHLSGIFYINRVGDETRSLVVKHFLKWNKRNASQPGTPVRYS